MSTVLTLELGWRSAGANVSRRGGGQMFTSLSFVFMFCVQNSFEVDFSIIKYNLRMGSM